eukprot:254467-Amphidinium_carterae.1
MLRTAPGIRRGGFSMFAVASWSVCLADKSIGCHTSGSPNVGFLMPLSVAKTVAAKTLLPTWCGMGFPLFYMTFPPNTVT